ncbi:MAG: hypothetical protein OQK24_04680 [Magnetovibrio sp.]|nr:hypothetical protein [Magnetovibrio sp.]
MMQDAYNANRDQAIRRITPAQAARLRAMRSRVKTVSVAQETSVVMWGGALALVLAFAVWQAF